MTSFNLHYFSKGPVSKYRHILRYWGLGFHHLNLGRHSLAHKTSSDMGAVCSCLPLLCAGHLLTSQTPFPQERLRDQLHIFPLTILDHSCHGLESRPFFIAFAMSSAHGCNFCAASRESFQSLPPLSASLLPRSRPCLSLAPCSRSQPPSLLFLRISVALTILALGLSPFSVIRLVMDFTHVSFQLSVIPTICFLSSVAPWH